jgi:formylglycine-generating enzyme
MDMENYLQHLPGRSEPFQMIAIKGGRFDMGGEDCLPVHPVEVDDFWMGEYPVTQRLWTDVTGVVLKFPYSISDPSMPAECISWTMVDQDFLPHLNELTRNHRPPGTVYRLPTEAEWEYAAQGGRYAENTPVSYILSEAERMRKDSPDPIVRATAATKNALGLYNLGVMMELCSDWCQNTYYEECLQKGVVKNPRGPEIPDYWPRRIVRSGTWIDDTWLFSSALRDAIAPDRNFSGVGFRLVLSATIL